MAEVRGLPFGRPASQPPQAQFVDERRQDLPRSVGGWVCAANPYVFTGTSTTTANQIVLSQLPYFSDVVTANTVRIRCTTASASTSARVAIYFRDSTGFRKLEGSEASFSTAGTGLLNASLGQILELEPEIRYYIGFRCTSATPAFSALVSTNAIYDTISVTDTGAQLPSAVNTSAVSVGQNAVVGVVYYDSRLFP